MAMAIGSKDRNRDNQRRDDPQDCDLSPHDFHYYCNELLIKRPE